VFICLSVLLVGKKAPLRCGIRHWFVRRGRGREARCGGDLAV